MIDINPSEIEKINSHITGIFRISCRKCKADPSYCYCRQRVNKDLGLPCSRCKRLLHLWTKKYWKPLDTLDK